MPKATSEPTIPPKQVGNSSEPHLNGNSEGQSSPVVYLSPARGIPTVLIRTYLETLALAPAKIWDGHNGHPREDDVVLHNGNHRLESVKQPKFRLIVYLEGWHVLDMAFWKRRGACGWLDLQDDPEEFQHLLRQAMNGQTPVATASARPHLNRLDTLINKKLGKHLTQRELDTSVLLLKGFSDKQIAKELKITAGTVHNHRKSIYRKVGVHSISQLIHRLRLA